MTAVSRMGGMPLGAAAGWYGTTTARLRALLAGRLVVDPRTGAEKVASSDLPALERRLRALLHCSTTWHPVTGEHVAYSCDIPVVRSWARRHARP